MLLVTARPPGILQPHAIRALSDRRAGPFIARNAATLSAGIIDAELFGHASNYPNPGMRERLGLVGQASGGTLFLDELAELTEDLQSHLLRVLDSGEYSRLGDSEPRRADLRLLGATNRTENSIKHDLFARFKLRLQVPGLDEHPEDIPLIAKGLLCQAAGRDPAIRRQFFETSAEFPPEPRIDPMLVDALLRHQYTHHVRELESLLFLAMAGSRDRYIALTSDVRERLSPPRVRDPTELTAEQIQSSLERNRGSVSRAFRELGLSSRDALYRMMKKHDLKARGK